MFKQHKVITTAQTIFDPYQFIFENAHVGIALLNLDGCFLKVNPMLCQILGYSSKELIGANFQQFTHQDDLETNLTYLAQATRNEITNYSMDKRYCRKDGSIIWVRIDVSLTSLPPDNKKLLIAVVQDIQQQKLTELALKDQELRAKTVLDTSIDGFWTVSALDGTILEVNSVYCQLSGYSKAELLGMRVSDLDCKETQEEVADHIKRVIERGGDVFKTRHIRKNGEIWPVEVTVTYSEIGGKHFFVFLRDISKRYTNKALLNLRVSLSDLVHRGSLDSISQTAVDSAEKLTNSQIGFLHILDADEQHITHQIWSNNTIKTFCSSYNMGLHYPISEAGVWVDCIRQRRTVIHNDYAMLPHKKGLPEGHPAVIREMVVPIIRNDLIVAVLGVGNKPIEYTKTDIKVVRKIGNMVFDYIERKLADDRVEFMAYYDALTKLPNRILLNDRIKQSIAQTERSGTLLAVAYIDLDGFKPINDRYGHAVGDEFLAAFAQRMVRLLRAVDTMARLGGDEFALILPGLTYVHDAEIILWRLLEALAAPFCISAHEVKVGASIGFTIYPLDDNDADTLLRHADQAMYQAKWDGKNTVRLYDTAQSARLHFQQETIEHLRKALTSDELVLYYQPNVNLITGDIVSVGTELRWYHPKRGLLKNAEFFPIIKGTQEAMRLDEWLIRKVLAQLAFWETKGITLPISVNISFDTLDKLEFLDFIQDQTAYLPKKLINKLEIEATIPWLNTDLNTLTVVMHGCAELGINFAITEIGINQLSKHRILQLPIHRLKLGDQLVKNMPKNADNINIINELANFSKKLSLPSIAQGVDNLSIAALLIDLGYTVGQGLAIALPMPAISFKDWQQSWFLNPVYQELRTLSSEPKHSILLQVAIRAVQRWSDELTDFVNSGGRSKCPMLCSDQCQMNAWYNGLGLFRYGSRPGFAFQAARHRALHLQAASIAELIECGFCEQARANLLQFYEQCDEFIDMLSRLDYIAGTF